jgi:phosphoesterase RecJ-like protein
VATTAPTDAPDAIAAIRAIVAGGQRFLITSHARPDGDAIGSQLALALALRQLGKTVRVVNRDPVPEPFRPFPGCELVEVAAAAEGDFDALFVMECSDLARPGVAGLERYRTVNIDHHLGNTGFGEVTWLDEGAAACAELVADLLDGLGVAWSPAIATQLYLGILTDTGGFRHSHISARTFEVCRRIAAAGVDPAAVARQVYDTGSTGRLKLMGTLLDRMRLEADGRLAVLWLDDAILSAAGASYDDTDGMINLPLSAAAVRASVMFKRADATGEVRVSMRSKGAIDVRAVAQRYGGGGHRNAAGFTAPSGGGPVYEQIVREIAALVAP